jgi:hypothetical protein
VSIWRKGKQQQFGTFVNIISNIQIMNSSSSSIGKTESCCEDVDGEAAMQTSQLLSAPHFKGTDHEK